MLLVGLIFSLLISLYGWRPGWGWPLHTNITLTRDNKEQPKMWEQGLQRDKQCLNIIDFWINFSFLI